MPPATESPVKPPTSNNAAEADIEDIIAETEARVNAIISVQDIVPLLRSASEINEICKSEEIESDIQNLLAVHDDKLLNISYLKEAQAKNEIEIDILTVRNTERNTNNLVEYEDDLREEELEIERLEAELQKKRRENQMLSKRRLDNIRIGEDIREMAKKQSSSLQSSKENEIIMKDIEKLKSQTDLVKQRIADYDADLESYQHDRTHHGDTSSTTNALFIGLCSRVESLLNESNNDQNPNLNSLIANFKAIETELKGILRKIEAAKENEEKTKRAKAVYYQILYFVNDRVMYPDQVRENNVDFEKFNELFPHNNNTTVPQLPFIKSALELTCILLKLYNEGDISLPNLTAYIESLVQEHGLSKNVPNTTIYKLAAANLVSIDRSHKDSLEANFHEIAVITK
ncbi:hypothetical protein INT48_004162 [Thamnidium elegans]|uniref:Uncharacterized protein n=1 Tax=Thamnidium elegans TaxID=101142 RepID=A0A8H7SSE2_9FUNG|nr:hypothetical protein INT48_004162 [Thamnidium elegans]